MIGCLAPLVVPPSHATSPLSRQSHSRKTIMNTIVRRLRSQKSDVEPQSIGGSLAETSWPVPTAGSESQAESMR